MAKSQTPPAGRPPAPKPAAAPPPKHGRPAESYARDYYAWLRSADPAYLVSLLRQGGPAGLADHVAGVGRHARELYDHHRNRGAPDAEAKAAAESVLSRDDHDPPAPADPAAVAAAIEEWEGTDEAAPFLPE